MRGVRIWPRSTGPPAASSNISLKSLLSMLDTCNTNEPSSALGFRASFANEVVRAWRRWRVHIVYLNDLNIALFNSFHSFIVRSTHRRMRRFGPLCTLHTEYQVRAYISFHRLSSNPHLIFTRIRSLHVTYQSLILHSTT